VTKVHYRWASKSVGLPRSEDEQITLSQDKAGHDASPVVTRVNLEQGLERKVVDADRPFVLGRPVWFGKKPGAGVRHPPIDKHRTNPPG